MKNALKMMTDGIEMSSVVVWKNALTVEPIPVKPHVVRPNDEGQESKHEHGKNERLVTPKRFARIVGQDFGDDAHGRQNQHVNFRVPEEPEQVLPQKRTAAAADVQWRSVDDHPSRHEKTGRRHAIHDLHDDRCFQRRKREDEKKRRDKLRPDEKRQAHPGQPFGAQLDDRRDEIDRSEQGRSDQKNKSDEPERLAIPKWMKRRTCVRHDRERCIRGPTAFGRAARHEKARQHDDAANPERPEAGRVDLRKRHVRRADLQRHDKIAEGRERHRHDAEENHDRSMHRAE